MSLCFIRKTSEQKSSSLIACRDHIHKLIVEATFITTLGSTLRIFENFKQDWAKINILKFETQKIHASILIFRFERSKSSTWNVILKNDGGKTV
jgi:hypothetical protein